MAIRSLEIETIEGRGGLKIPGYAAFKDEVHSAQPRDLFEFFDNLWGANGYSTTILATRRGETAYGEFHHLITIPPSSRFPLLFVKGDFSPAISMDELKYRERRNRENDEWGQWSSTTVGNEVHGVFAASETISAPLQPLVTVSFAHQHGGSGGRWSDRTEVFHLGEMQRQLQTKTPEDKDWRVHSEELEAEFHTRIGVLYQGVVELLTDQQ